MIHGHLIISCRSFQTILYCIGKDLYGISSFSVWLPYWIEGSKYTPLLCHYIILIISILFWRRREIKSCVEKNHIIYCACQMRYSPYYQIQVSIWLCMEERFQMDFSGQILSISLILLCWKWFHKGKSVQVSECYFEQKRRIFKMFRNCSYMTEI